MKFFEYFVIGILCCAVVSSEFRPLESSDDVRKLELDTRDGEIKYRLPNNTKPETYDITLLTAVDQDNFNFDGTVKIRVHVLETTSNITIHARQLTITNIELTDPNTGTNIDLDSYTYELVTEFLIIPTKTQLEKDKVYLLVITYTGELRTDNGGFYRSSYVDGNGVTKYLATTQFESTDARHAFPCYDEPAFKANFTIHIIHGESYRAISNTNGTTKSYSTGKSKTDFISTPPTSTYLIAFIVSDFQYAEKNVSDSNPIYQRVFTSKNKLSQTAYALDEGVKILNAISKYVSVEFTLKKMDQAAIPNFRAGAMENWGLVTYREPYLLYDPSVHLPSRQLSISTIIAHEYGHQWFGNLVSPKWWTYIWLNEGFATLFEYLGAGLVHEDWNIWNDFVANKLQPVLRIDAQSTTRAMTTYAESPNGVSGLFDQIAYAKSGSVIRMFLHALGEETFKKGLKYYLTAQKFSVADEDNLFDNLDKAAKEDKTLHETLTVNQLFGSWSNQKGFPLLKVIRNENGSVTLYQEKYDAVKPNEVDPSTWWIPFNFATAKEPEFNVTTPLAWMPKEPREYLIASNETKWTKDDWLIFNRQQTGFYRVLYDDHNYDLINKELNSDNFEKIHEINRAQYIDDLNDFVSTGRLPPKHLFNALPYLAREYSYAPWVSARRSILELNQIFAVSGKLNEFHDYTSQFVAPFYTNKTLEATENESIYDKLSRNIAVDLACRFGVSQCLSDTYKKFAEFIASSEKPSQENRGLIYAHGIRNATAAQLISFWKIFLATSSDEERNEVITSLGNIQDPTEIQRFINKTIDEDAAKLNKADRVSILQSILGGSQAGLQHTIAKLTYDLDIVNSTVGSVPTILTSIASKIVSADTQTKFFDLLDLAKTKGFLADTDVEKHKKTVNEKVNWQLNNLQSYEDALPKAGPNSAAQMTALPILIVLMFGLIRWNAE